MLATLSFTFDTLGKKKLNKNIQTHRIPLIASARNTRVVWAT